MSRETESKAGAVAAAIIVCPAIATLSVLLRVYTRFYLTKSGFLEDYFIVASMFFSVAMSVFMGLSVVYGFGRHVEFVSEEDHTNQLKVSIGAIFCYFFTHMLLRLSIILQYLRISVMPFEARLCRALIVFVVAQCVALTIALFLTCIPFEAMWTSNIPGAKCLNRTASYSAQLGLSIGTDFLVLIAPLFILRHLHITWPQRLLLCIVLGFGAAACIVSILRLLTVRQSTQSTDGTWDKVPSSVYGAIEPNLGILCACLVTLRPLFCRHRRKPDRGMYPLENSDSR